MFGEVNIVKDKKSFKKYLYSLLGIQTNEDYFFDRSSRYFFDKEI